MPRESLADALARLGAAGVGAEELAAAPARVSVEPVLTAHPTEATRRTCSPRTAASPRCLRELDDPALPPTAAAEVEDRARRGDHDPLADRRGALAPAARRRRDPARASGSSRRACGRRRRGCSPSCARALPAAPAPLRFGTWIGGDMDGNPHAGADTIEEALERARALARALPRREMRELARGLGDAAPDSSSRPASARVASSPAEQNADEPYRRRLTVDLAAARRRRATRSAERAARRSRPARREPARAPRRPHRRRRRSPTLRRRRRGLRPPPRQARRSASTPRRCASRTSGSARRSRRPRGCSERHGVRRSTADRLDDAARPTTSRPPRRSPRRPGSRSTSCRCSRRSPTCAAPARSSPSSSTGARARDARGDGRLLGLGQGRRLPRPPTGRSTGRRRQLAALAGERGVELTVFHGRGGAPGAAAARPTRRSSPSRRTRPRAG